MDRETLEHLFTYQAPTEAQIPLFKAIREAGKYLAETINNCAPPSADATAAIRKVREAVMTANAALACFPIRVEIEQVADQITFKSYYLNQLLEVHETSKMRLTAIGSVDQALGTFYELSARACKNWSRTEAFRYATQVAVREINDSVIDSLQGRLQVKGHPKVP